MLKWVVSGGSGGKGSSTAGSGRTTPVSEQTHTHDGEVQQMKQTNEVNNNDNMDFGRLPPLPFNARHAHGTDETDFGVSHMKNRFVKGSDPLYQTARGRLQSRRSRLNEQINREIRLRSGAENLLKATANKKLRETVSLELSFVNSNLQLLKEEMADLNSSVDIYQGNNCAQCIPMIPLGLKETKDIDYVTPLKEFLSEHYHVHDDKYIQAIEQIQTVRQACRTPVRSQEGVDLLYKYYNHLYFLEKRFFNPSKNLGIQFEWYDSLTGVPSIQRTVGFEKGSILFNVGALLTQIGARQDRLTIEGLENAISSFQQAAGAFKYLRDHFTHAPSKDMQGPTLDMLIHLMLSQSQECVFERKGFGVLPEDMAAHIMVAHEAAMVSDMYSETKQLMCQDPVSQYTPPPWLCLVEAKAQYYKALAHYHAAIAVLDQHDSDNVSTLAENFDNLHIWNPNRKNEESVAAKVPQNQEDRETFAKSHLRQSVLAHEDALHVHNQSRQLRKIDTFHDILRLSHDRSLQKFSTLEEEDDFSELLQAPPIQPRTESTASVESPDFSQHKVDDLFYDLGPLVIFSARHLWTEPRDVAMKKDAGQEFGFSVRGDSPVIIAAVEPGSMAERCGMKVGDFIIGVSKQDTRWFKHEETVALIRQAASHLTLKLVTPLDKNYVDGRESPANSQSLPPTPNLPQRMQGPGSVKKPGHKKTASGSSGSGWIMRRKRSSSKEKHDKHHTMDNGRTTELHTR